MFSLLNILFSLVNSPGLNSLFVILTNGEGGTFQNCLTQNVEIDFNIIIQNRVISSGEKMKDSRYQRYNVIFLTGTPLKVPDYIVNPIKKVLSVRIYLQKKNL